MVEAGDITLHELPKVQQGLAAYKRLKAQEKPDIPALLPNPWNIDLPVEQGK